MRSRRLVAAMWCATGSLLASGAFAQNNVPFQINDAGIGLSSIDPNNALQQVRGPATLLGGVQTTSSWVPFMQSIQFDNRDGFSHAFDGNMLAVDFGTTAGGGSLNNASTQVTTSPGPVQSMFDWTASPGSPITRLNGISASPDNKHIAFTGFDSPGQNVYTYAMDYSQGATPGTGAGASVTNLRQATILPTSGSNSNTVGTTWLDNSNFLAVMHPTVGGAASGSLVKFTLGAGNTMTQTPVATVPFVAGAAAFSSVLYQPTLSPYVYVMVSQFSGSTFNTLMVLDPNNNYAQVGSFDYSTSSQTSREISFDSHGNLFIGEFNAGGTGPIMDVVPHGNILANLANNNSIDWYTTAISSSFSGQDIAAAALDWKTAGVTVDMRTKSVTVPYFTGTVNDPKDQIRQRLFTGRNNGAWNGTGSAIISSDAAAANPKNKAIGYVEASDINKIGGQWGGVTVEGPSILMKYTYYGDTDLNGKVNFDDYARIDGGFNTGGTDWFHGDFNYNGKVNFDDYALIDAAFNSQSGVLSRAMSWLSGDDRSQNGMTDPALRLVEQHYAEFGDAYARSFIASVPEPTTLGIVALTAIAALPRRRARR